MLSKASDDISFSILGSATIAGGISSRVKSAVRAQGPYIPSKTTTKSIRQKLEKLLLCLKNGEDVNKADVKTMTQTNESTKPTFTPSGIAHSSTYTGDNF